MVTLKYCSVIFSHYNVTLEIDIQILLCDIKGQNLDIIIPSHDVKVSYSDKLQSNARS